MPKINIDEFNNDPKFENERNEFDALFAGAFARMTKKTAEENPPKDEGFLNSFFSSIAWKVKNE